MESLKIMLQPELFKQIKGPPNNDFTTEKNWLFIDIKPLPNHNGHISWSETSQDYFWTYSKQHKGD